MASNWLAEGAALVGRASRVCWIAGSMAFIPSLLLDGHRIFSSLFGGTGPD
jgi:hypothetical protein